MSKPTVAVLGGVTRRKLGAFAAVAAVALSSAILLTAAPAQAAPGTADGSAGQTLTVSQAAVPLAGGTVTVTGDGLQHGEGYLSRLLQDARRGPGADSLVVAASTCRVRPAGRFGSPRTHRATAKTLRSPTARAERSASPSRSHRRSVTPSIAPRCRALSSRGPTTPAPRTARRTSSCRSPSARTRRSHRPSPRRRQHRPPALLLPQPQRLHRLGCSLRVQPVPTSSAASKFRRRHRSGQFQF